MKKTAMIFGALAVACSAMAPLMAKADDEIQLPHRKAGMWEQAVQLPGGNSMTMQMCTDEATESHFSALGKQLKGEGCTQDIKKTADGYTFKGSCQGHNVSGKVTGDFSKALKVEVDSDNNHVTMDQKWLGACPADRKPGDVVLPGGRVMNIKDIAG